MAQPTREADQGPPVPEVRRFTTKYVPEEDRIQLLVELTSGDVKVAWLTRRLLNMVLPPVLKRLEVVPTEKPPEAAAAVQRFTQAAAVRSIQRQPAVASYPEEAPRSPDETLIITINVRLRGKTMFFDLKAGDAIVVTLPFSEQALRQWLGVLYGQYHAAEWTESFWPAWMDLSSQEAVAAMRLN
jgi:hypothetical protein